MSNNETQADIIREMRDLGALDAQCNDMIPRSLQALGLRTYADRLEAAAQRDKQDAMKTALMAKCEICARLSPQGNAARLAKALFDPEKEGGAK